MTNRAVVWESKPYLPVNIDETKILPGVPDALKQSKAAGFVLIVVSNQPNMARGTTPRESVEAINAYLAERLLIDRFIMCYHDRRSGRLGLGNPSYVSVFAGRVADTGRYPVPLMAAAVELLKTRSKADLG